MIGLLTGFSASSESTRKERNLSNTFPFNGKLVRIEMEPNKRRWFPNCTASFTKWLFSDRCVDKVMVEVKVEWEVFWIGHWMVLWEFLDWKYTKQWRLWQIYWMKGCKLWHLCGMINSSTGWGQVMAGKTWLKKKHREWFEMQISAEMPFLWLVLPINGDRNHLWAWAAPFFAAMDTVQEFSLQQWTVLCRNRENGAVCSNDWSRTEVRLISLDLHICLPYLESRILAGCSFLVWSSLVQPKEVSLSIKEGRTEVLPIPSLLMGLMRSFLREKPARVLTTWCPASRSPMWLPVMQEERGGPCVLSQFRSLGLLSALSYLLLLGANWNSVKIVWWGLIFRQVRWQGVHGGEDRVGRGGQVRPQLRSTMRKDAQDQIWSCAGGQRQDCARWFTTKQRLLYSFHILRHHL